MCGFARLLQCSGQAVVVGKQAAAHATQRNHAGAGQGGDVHHGSRLEAGRIGQRIAQHQAAFGVGVQNLDGLPAHARDHIAGLHGAAIGHVLAGRDQPHYVDGRLQLAQRAERAQHAGGATHVELHFVHLGRGLDRDAPGVKGDALAHQHHGRLVLGGAVVAQLDETQRLFRATGNGHEGAHAQTADLGRAVDLALDARQLGQRLGGIGQQAGRGMVGRAVAPFARKLHPRHQRHTPVKAFPHLGGAGHTDHTAAQAAGLCLGFGGGVDIARLGHRLHGSAHGICRGGARPTQHHPFGVRSLDRTAHRQHSLAQRAGRAITAAHQHHAARGHGGHLVQLQLLARLQRQISVLERQRRQGRQGVRPRLETLGNQHHQQVAFL